jgi:putative effector of murein hydrolase
VLSALLPPTLALLGFTLYASRERVLRSNVAVVTLLSSALTLGASCAAAKALGLSPEWGRALLTRSVASSAVLPLAQALGAPALCAVAVMLTQALLVVAFGPLALRVLGVRAPARAGVAAGATAGALGAAAVAGSDPRALPYGIAASLLASAYTALAVAAPPTQQALLRLVG